MSSTVPCRYCGVDTPATETRCCSPCFELASRIKLAPVVAMRLLFELDPEMLVAGMERYVADRSKGAKR